MIVLLAKDKYYRSHNSKALIDSYITHDEFVSVNNVVGEYDGMKETVKNLKASAAYQNF